MIEKILDNYYSKKLCKYIKNVSLKWHLDKKIIINKEKIIFKAKLPKFNDEQYVNIIAIPKQDAFIYLCDYKTLKEDVINAIKEYIEYAKENN